MVFSGVPKAMDPLGFIQSIYGFEIIVDPWAAWVALGLPWLEIFCGLGILLRILYSGSLAIISGMMVTFMIAFSSVWLRGINIECGCFGDKIPIPYYWINLLIDGSLLLMALGLLLGERARLRAVVGVSN